MADVVDGAVFRVQRSAPTDELLQFGTQHSELGDAFLDVDEFGVEKFVDMTAWGGAVVAEADNAGDLGECEPSGLGVADEVEAIAVRGGVHAVAVCRAGGFGEETPGFVEADGPCRMTRDGGEFPDTHNPHITP